MNLNLPAENAKDKVEHEEGSDDNERHEESPVEHVPNGIVGLEKTQGHIEHVCTLNVFFTDDFMAVDAGGENCYYVI